MRLSLSLRHNRGFRNHKRRRVKIDEFPIQYINAYVEFRKLVTRTLYARQQKRHRWKEQTFGLCGTRRGWDDLGEWH